LKKTTTGLLIVRVDGFEVIVIVEIKITEREVLWWWCQLYYYCML